MPPHRIRELAQGVERIGELDHRVKSEQRPRLPCQACQRRIGAQISARYESGPERVVDERGVISLEPCSRSILVYAWSGASDSRAGEGLMHACDASEIFAALSFVSTLLLAPLPSVTRRATFSAALRSEEDWR